MMGNFALDVQKFADSFEDGAEQAIRGTTIKLFSAFVDSSPVDEGRFRGNWFVTGKQPSTKVTFNTDKNGTNTKNKIESSIAGIKDWSTFTATNNLPYSEVIEFGGYKDGPNTTGGFSKQAPQGVVRVNIMRFNKLLTEEAKKALPK